MKRILLINLGSNGDCVMVTTVARQIKTDYPDCHLTWVVISKFAGVLLGNPDVDVIWKVEPTETEKHGQELWQSVYNMAVGNYVLIYTTQVYPNNASLFDGTIRSSLFRGYPGPITVPVVPVMRLSKDEYEHVKQFAESKQLAHYKHVILMECTPSSGQSVVTLDKGIEIAEALVTQYADAVVLISTHVKFESPHERILNAGELSFRENIALSHYCTLFIGCGSGISWLLLSDSAKKLNMVLYISRVIGICFASLAYDLKYWNLPTDHIIENDTVDLEEMKAVALNALGNFESAQKRYHKEIRPAFWGCLFLIDRKNFVKGVLTFFRKTLRLYFQRNKFTVKEILSFPDLLYVLSAIGKRTLRKV